MYWSSSCGRIELNITKAQAVRGAHPGPCDNDIAALRTVPAIRRQLAKLNPEHVEAYLQEFGAWDEIELMDHDANLDRLLWIACGDINEDMHQ